MTTMRRLLLTFAALMSAATVARAQCGSAIRPRLMVVVDTSSYGTLHMLDNNPALGDGSTSWSDPTMTRSLAANSGFALYPGARLAGTVCTDTRLSSYDGPNSRLYASKSALGSAVSAMGQADWGLLRFASSDCPVVTTRTKSSCTSNSQCGTGSTCVTGACTCTSDSNCHLGGGYFCMTGVCWRPDNLCVLSDDYQAACSTDPAPLTTSSTCGTSVPAGNATCATPQVCYADADCNGAVAGECALAGSGPVRTCACGGAFPGCPSGYACTGGRCVYADSCQSGGSVAVDPATANNAGLILPWLDGVEVVSSTTPNPELRAEGSSPVAASIRTATAWYNTIKNGNQDAQILCRPYELVLILNQPDSCDTEPVNGPVAAAGGFVAATAPGAKHPNTIHVIAAALNGASQAPFDAIARAGGTGSAHLAASAADISSLLNSIAATAPAVELCNNADDDCDGFCDEPFPDVAVTNPVCANRHAAASCNNGQPATSGCYRTGTYVCSADQLSEVCNAPPPPTEAAGGCNFVDDDCNGIVDDCTPGVAGSCCH
jgi:hypothetical protein